MSRALVTATVFFAVLAVLLMLGEVPAWVLLAYGLFSGMAIMVYSGDKSAAVNGRWRTSESTLHAIGLVGGWPGALVARHVLRHKTSKQPFRTIFWVTVIVNCVALAGFISLSEETLQSVISLVV